MPAQNHFDAKYLRAGGSAIPTRIPAMKKMMEYLVSRPSPTAAPIASHQRGFSVLSRRMVNHATSTHHKKANEVY